MTNNFHIDLVAALSVIKNPPLDGDAAYGKYSTINACLKKAKAALTSHNFCVIQMFYTEPDRLVTRIVHASGEFIEDGGVPLYCVDKNNPQKLMAAGTYARRNGLCALLGIAGSDDDDGQSATPLHELPEVKKPKPAPEPKPPELPRQDSQVFNDVGDTFDAPKTPQAASAAYEQTADTIEEWVKENIAGFEKHKHTGEHKRWSTQNAVTLKSIKQSNPASYQQLVTAFQQRKLQLEGKTNA
jgi:hypothetical protein